MCAVRFAYFDIFYPFGFGLLRDSLITIVFFVYSLLMYVL